MVCVKEEIYHTVGRGGQWLQLVGMQIKIKWLTRNLRRRSTFRRYCSANAICADIQCERLQVEVEGGRLAPLDNAICRLSIERGGSLRRAIDSSERMKGKWRCVAKYHTIIIV